MSGSAVDYRKRPLVGVTNQGADERVAAAPPVTWSGVLQAVELNLSTAEIHLGRVADGSVDGPAQGVAIDAANVVHAVQVMGTLIRMLHERLEQVEGANGYALQPNGQIASEAAQLMANRLSSTTA